MHTPTQSHIAANSGTPAAHTPGPLHLGMAAGDVAIYGPKGEHVATLPSMLDKSEVLANGRLFCAAPDLLAALDEVEDATGDLMSRVESDGLTPRQIAGYLVEIQTMARAAIARATGKERAE